MEKLLKELIDGVHSLQQEMKRFNDSLPFIRRMTAKAEAKIEMKRMEKELNDSAHRFFEDHHRQGEIWNALPDKISEADLSYFTSSSSKIFHIGMDSKKGATLLCKQTRISDASLLTQLKPDKRECDQCRKRADRYIKEGK